MRSLKEDARVRSNYGLRRMSAGAVLRKFQRRVDPLGYVSWSYRRMGTEVSYSLNDRIRYSLMVALSPEPIHTPNGN